MYTRIRPQATHHRIASLTPRSREIIDHANLSPRISAPAHILHTSSRTLHTPTAAHNLHAPAITIANQPRAPHTIIAGGRHHRRTKKPNHTPIIVN
jgi:hypothetical protein